MNGEGSESQLRTGNLEVTTGFFLAQLEGPLYTGTRMVSTSSRSSCSACSDFLSVEE